MDKTEYAYAQVRKSLAEKIDSKLLVGSLPSERELCQSYDISRSTLRQALGQLENMGLIYRKNRSGWYVCPRKLKYDPMQHVSFLQYTTEQDFEPSTVLVNQVKQKPCKEIADALNGTDKIVLVKNPVKPELPLWLGAIERIYTENIKK